MKSQDMERREAIQAADIALDHLYSAQDLLSSAGNWGMYDMLGGGFFASAIKRDKMRNAERELESAREALRAFVREVHDVEGMAGVHIETDDFLSFADMFFDNFFVDLYVQRRIDDARRQLSQAISQVEIMRDRLVRGM